jgi:benzoate membrane transport protein
MSLDSGSSQRGLPTIGAAIPVLVLMVIVLSLPLAAAQAMQLSDADTNSWILSLYALPSLLSLALIARYRQPLALTGNIFVIIFIVSLGDQFSYAELVGAAVLAGAAVIVLTVLRLTDRLAAWIPVPIAYGLLAGASMPFVSNVFTTFGDAPVLVGATFVAYVLSRFALGNRLPAVVPAAVAGLVVAALSGQLGQVATGLSLPLPTITVPVFSLPAIVTITPVLVILIEIQSNLPSLVFLQSQGYRPPGRIINMVSGVGAMLGSILGPTGVSLSLPVTSLVAGPGAGERHVRHRAAYLVSAGALLIGLLAGVAADLAMIIPLSLLLTLAGLALVDVLVNALQRITQGPLVLGPAFAFAIALSQISFLGLGPFFWSPILGTGISLVLERDKLRELRKQVKQELPAEQT